MTPHPFVSVRWLAWPVCRRCGLIRLGNRATEKAVQKGCYPEKNDNKTKP